MGYDLYLELLQSTVADLKEQTAQGSDSFSPSKLSEPSEPVLEPEVMLRVAAFLPDDYVQDTVLRYRLYRRLSVAGNQDPEQLADLRDEIRDRFGPIPRETDALFALVGLKYRLRQLGIIKLEQGPANLVFSFGQHSPVAPETLLAFIAHSQPHSQPQLKKKKEARPDRLGRLNKRLRVPTKKLAPEPGEPVRLTPDQRLIVALDENIEQVELFQRIEGILRFLSKNLV